jgi:alpha,alpha-trehalase
MKNFTLRHILLLLTTVLLINCNSQKTLEKEEVKILPPEELYGQLFYDVQSNENIFEDSKTFVDAVPLYSVKEIRDNYSKLKSPSDSELSDFVKEHFKIPGEGMNYVTDSSSINMHISKLWEVLKRPADENISGTLIPLPNPYIVPGGRFREIYYWDSYFTMLGLQEDGQIEAIEDMVDNFSYLIDRYGFIPNGNRTYYLSRSQPPFYAEMVEVLAESKGDSIYKKYLKFLEKEYEFWMDGSENLTETAPSFRRVVRLPDGEILNRYWDDKDTPRPESYREDIKTAEDAIAKIPGLKKEDVFRNLRAGAESGWDFSSRWLKKDDSNEFQLSTIHTTEIIPVDLNTLLYNLESKISKAHAISGHSEKSEIYKLKSESRKQAILKYFWSEEEHFFMDYDFQKQQSTPVISLAGVYPLFFKIADEAQANAVAEKIQDTFLKPGGVVSTPYNTGQQWDAPNGWAPLQWITAQGLKNYGQEALAADIKEKWLGLNQRVYQQTYKMLEKYNVEDLSKESGGGEYPTQDGFGWTNGVYQKLSKE